VPNSKEVINYSSFCGGTVINHRHVITAAHCIPIKIEYKGLSIPVVANGFFRTYESMIKVYLAVYNRTLISKTTTQNAFTVQKLIKHENYDAMKLLNDIAILRLDETIVFNNEIQPCCLPENKNNNFPSNNTESIVIGWGQTENGNSSAYLKNAKIQIFDSYKCSNVSLGIKKVLI
jgi:secreted trypsin-like serine protease